MRSRLLPLTLLLLCPPIYADWNQFRGPTAQGQSESKNLPTEWIATKNITWKKEIPGFGWSSPVIVGGKICLTTAVGSPKAGAALHVLCLEAAAGGIAWDKEIFKADNKSTSAIHPKNSLASPTPSSPMAKSMFTSGIWARRA